MTACSSGTWESRLAASASADDESRIRIVRRCVDVGELITASSTAEACCALVDSRLPGLDAGTVATLTSAGVAVIAVVADDAESERMRAIGVRTLARAEAGFKELVIAVQASLVADVTTPSIATPPPRAGGRVHVVWGAHGAPGRSTVAMTLADECAASGISTLLIDADVHGGSLAQMLGVLDEAPGIVAATRLAHEGRLDAPVLLSCVRALPSGLMVLTGITRPQRWTELRPESFIEVLEVARTIAGVVVVDVASSIEQDEELFFDTMAPRRNGLTISTLTAADAVLMVAAADPVGMQRAVRLGLALPEELPGVEPHVVVNRLRKASLPAGSTREHISQVVKRHLGRLPVAVVPSDRPSCDKGLAAGRTLREVAPSSPARVALRDLAKRLVPESQRRWLRRNGRRPGLASAG